MQTEHLFVILFAVVCAIWDFKKKEVPIWIMGISGMTAILFVLVRPQEQKLFTVLYSMIPGAVLLTLSLLTRESIGYGDGFFVLVLGIFLGIAECIILVLIAFFCSSVFSLIILLLRKADGKTKIPFMPFLTGGMGIVLFAKYFP